MLAALPRERLIGYRRKGHPDYHESLAEFFTTIQSKSQIAEAYEGIPSLVAVLESGGGVALVPKSAVRLIGPRLRLISMSPAPMPLVIGLSLICSEAVNCW